MRSTTLLPLTGLLASLGLLAAACAPPGEDAASGDEDTGRGEHRLDVRLGDEVAIRGVRVLAPQRDRGVWAEIIKEDGTTETLHLRTDADGVVFLLDDALSEEEIEENAADDEAAEAEAAEEETDAGESDDSGDAPDEGGVASEQAGEASVGSAPGPCNDRGRNGLPYRWTQPYHWKFFAGSTPSSMSKDSVESKLRRAANNITYSRNSCGLADKVEIDNVYDGRTQKAPGVRANGTCTTTDGMNSVGFGDLPEGVLGVACTWYDGNNHAIESDVRFNKVDHRWYAVKPSSCSGRYSLEAVATHEFGHVFGLGHVGESGHGNLTMSPQVNGTCQKSEATLGRGDVIGLRAKY